MPKASEKIFDDFRCCFGLLQVGHVGGGFDYGVVALGMGQQRGHAYGDSGVFCILCPGYQADGHRELFDPWPKIRAAPLAELTQALCEALDRVTLPVL